MKLDDLMDAFQYLDDDLIESADIIRRNPQPVKKMVQISGNCSLFLRDFLIERCYTER